MTAPHADRDRTEPPQDVDLLGALQRSIDGAFATRRPRETSQQPEQPVDAQDVSSPRAVAPVGLPLHESADRDADNVPSEEPWREYAEAMCQVAHFDGWMVPVAIPGNLDPRYRVAACFQCQKAARACVAVEERRTAALVAEVERLRDGWRSVTSALGYGDGITEPQIGFTEFIRECEQRFSEADEWRESQRWRDECAMAGHPDDEDCFEHDPALGLERAEATIARVEALADSWAPSRYADRVRAALRGPEPAEATSNEDAPGLDVGADAPTPVGAEQTEGGA